MISGKSKSAKCAGLSLAVFIALWLLAGTTWGQTISSIAGTVKDSSGAVVAGATVTVKSAETSLTRVADSNENGYYVVPALSAGRYDVSAEKPGFKQVVQRGVSLVVAQQAAVNLTLEVGSVQQEVTVTGEVPIVNTTLSPTAGLVDEQQIKDLPLNGRSFDQLLTLNPRVANFSSTASTTAATTGSQLFTVSGRRYEENRFLMNGIDYVGTEMQGPNPQPFGASGKMLGVDAVREFNVVSDTYGAEYGKRAGGQVLIVTTSGTNQLHGDAFEFLRNSVLDARNYFDATSSAPPFKRNQFGGALGGPLKKDKLFLFGNYEGFRQRLGISSDAVVPDLTVRSTLMIPDSCGTYTLLPGTKTGMLPIVQSYWVVPNGPELTQAAAGGCPNAGAQVPTGLQHALSNPSQKIGENFGLVRFDYNISAKDSFSSNYLMDDGESDQPGRNPVSQAVIPQRAQLFSLQEKHTFSSSLINVFNAGFSRGRQTQTNVPYKTFPAAADFITGGVAGSGYPGKITVGQSTSVNNGNNIITGTINALALSQARNYTTGSDDVLYIRGNHSLSFGVWVQRVGNNFNGGSPGGQVAYLTLASVVTDAPKSFKVTTNPIGLGGRTTQAAWYIQDEIKLRPNLSLRVGLRDEMTSGFYEHHDQFSNYFSLNGVPQTIPFVGASPLFKNNAIALWQPRVGLAWDPTGKGTWAVRAGAGIYYDLQDSLLDAVSANWPAGGLQSFTKPAGGLLSLIPFNLDTAAPTLPPCTVTGQTGCARYALGGVDTNMHTPIVQEWSLTVEHELTKDMGIRIGYVGSQQYHGPISVDTNTIRSVVCATAGGCNDSGGNFGDPAPVTVPQGTLYVPVGDVPNPFIDPGQILLYDANSSYHGVSASFVKRSSHGVSLRVNYTYSKTLDTSSEGGLNDATNVLDPYHYNLSKGVASFNLTHEFSSNFSYELPFGKGKRFAGGANGFKERLIGGWQWNGIISAQTGFPLTALAGSNFSGNGDNSPPDVAWYNPQFKGTLYPKTADHWYDPNAFMVPTEDNATICQCTMINGVAANSAPTIAPPVGTFGNVGRGSLIGPGLVSVDTSLFKYFTITERANLQFRAEIFNIINHTNFGEPNAAASGGGDAGNLPNPSGGQILGTATSSRQIQFALKLNF